ncbi:hypothetical protein EKN38_25435 [Enterobacter sp. WCHEn045836]|uniref:baseplate complex protein n=1 Tax=Enterobacter sp. WCHEn045836 TaxID=2497434 RepID=UPI000F825CE2|nr:hypothetical protein [Enterobacter sp. WCHEn045836]RTP93091.1 hypothetical protein EKN38_25435 [Enterobacter sp. WCHEn045836]
MADNIEFALSGQAIRMKNIEVSVSMPIKEKDQSGQASSTATAEQGIKAKELSVSGVIPYDDEGQLILLYSLAEAQDGGGKSVRYRVNHDIARKIKLREATFVGSVKASKAANLLAWQVTFTLREFFSTAERKAESRSKGGATAQTAQGTTSATDTPEELSWFERVLKSLDTAIGPYEEDKK